MGLGSSIKKAIKKPFRKIEKAVKKAVSKSFKIMGEVTGLNTVSDKVRDELTPSYDVGSQEQSPPAPTAPLPEQYAQTLSTPEQISRRKRNKRNGLRIDLNTGGAPSGNGVNLPVG